MDVLGCVHPVGPKYNEAEARIISCFTLQFHQTVVTWITTPLQFQMWKFYVQWQKGGLRRFCVQWFISWEVNHKDEAQISVFDF
ncbi:hypothetical protein X801_02066 [Opisthorchis viverrini]|uniref:Uncharacterized protein n=1 Tax=Opisthorchis viverrini TaxID=6198 RepID=A0A1S8X5N5_OPIVI|nr:hypothetical protein X801_02066 [Opisthorchis viverrini]